MRRPGTWAITVAITALAVVTVATAGEGRTITLNWTESNRGANRPLMIFTVRSITLTGARWSVRASVTNRSRKTIRITQANLQFHPPEYGFGLLVPPRPCAPGVYCEWPYLGATQFRPRLPSALRPGQNWTGVFSGRGTLPRRRLLPIVFGRFVADGEPFHWITQHTFRP